MAKPSKGSMPQWKGVVDANQAVAILDTVHHWRSTRVNKTNGCPGYLVTITHGGARVTATRRTFVDAVNAAMAKLHGRIGKKPTETATGNRLRLTQ